MRDGNIRKLWTAILNADWLSVSIANINNDNDKCNAIYSIFTPKSSKYFLILSVQLHDKDEPWMTPVVKALISQHQDSFNEGDTIPWCHLGARSSENVSETDKAKKYYPKVRFQKLKQSNPSSWYKHIGTVTTGQAKTLPWCVLTAYY